MEFKTINLNGITYLEKLEGTNDWYWGSDYCQGDLYEAEEIFEAGHAVKCNRLAFVKYPEGEVIEPILPKDGQYFGTPVFDHGCIVILMADFTAGKIFVKQYDLASKTLETAYSFERKGIDDCYNLLLRVSPLFLSRDGVDGKYQILWPEKSEFAVEENETVYERIGENLISSKWYEDPDYREELIIRKYPTGELVERHEGSLMQLPNGEKWLVR